MKTSARRFGIGILFLLFGTPAVAGSYEDFFVAVRQDNPAEVIALLNKGFDPNTVNPNGVPAILAALQLNSPKVAKALALNPNTLVDVRTTKDESPLMLSAIKGYNDVSWILIQRDADINKPGWTPLHYAATGGNLEIVNELLAKHAYVDAESPNGTTALMMAALYGSADVVRALLAAEADLTVKNSLGLSALDFAQKSERKEIIELIASKMRVQRSKSGW
ncbi:ankyrin repeat domain-containing protein [Rhodoferax aquaticus]|uniref:Ankyrin repeat domain-containing protein n=1 Tax=Rhodoferax aquaticus TaxID=2527691 RepID=A0A515EPN5_9BURK|nr:ankyrin repeat domain-containing protein [Rhodoferax aquaticus]QDL54628.1 ankyrin repeat domain-containing protein [Rhodoferax aquaticus]